MPGSLFYTGCYPAHNSGEPALNPPHSLRRAGLLSAAQFRCGVHRRAKKMVVIGRTIRTFFCGRQVVIHSTICAVGKIRLLLSAAHFGISSAFQTYPDRVVIQRTFPAARLLSGAQFPNCRILAAVVIDGTFLKNPPYSAQPVLLFTAQFVFSGAERLLSGAQFAKIRFFCGASCRGLLVCAQFALQGRGCYRRHNTRIFQHGLLFSAHFPAAGFFHPLCWNAAHISHFSFFRARGCYTRHFLKIPQNFLCRHFPAKKLFYRCYAPHIVAFYTFVLECCAQHRCNTAHICIGIFDIAILLF